MYVLVHLCVCARVCMRERERKCDKKYVCGMLENVYVCARVCVCERVRKSV